MNENQLTVGQVLSILSRNRAKCLLVFGLVFGLVVAYWMFAPRKYGSEGRLIVPIGRADTGISFTENKVPVSIQNARETKVRTVMELVKSYEVLGKVVEDPEVTTEAILDSGLSLRRLIPGLSGKGDSDSARHLGVQNAVKKLQENMTVSMEKNTELISIYATARSPELARTIVDKIMAYTSEAYMEVHSRSATVDALETEVNTKRDVVQELERRYAEFKNGIRLNSQNEAPITDIAAARNTLQAILDKLDHERVDLELNRAQALEEVARLDRELKDIGPLLEVPTQGVERKSTETAQEEIFKLKSERADLASKFRDHPRLEIINQRLLELEQDLNALPTDRTQMVSISNPAYEDVRVDRARAVTRAEAAGARLKKVNEHRDVVLADVRRINLLNLESEQLQRELAAARRYYDMSVKSRGDALAMMGMDKMKVSDLVVQQSGRFWPKHVAPRGSILLPLGLILATALALLTALVAEGGSKILNPDNDEIDEVLDLPVLITLPRVASRRSIVR